ncbi:MAG: ABC-F family ATP-binding cassette domain-containing protein [Tannerellaceae bacterium]|jgi:ATP-binding cassette subfamily F protein uup|nr:ABC-F family ATP-binding cassette domain-containing protein [Tannerellaceae bacterium]
MISFLQINGLTKRFGDLTLFENLTFGLAQGDKVGLIAKNGAGKTTLLNIIAGRDGCEGGEVVFRKDLRIAYLEQEPRFRPEASVWEAMNPPADNELQARQILDRLGISNLEQRVGELSGGQLKRISLAKTLIGEPELIILDEPTNHLDLDMTEWLENHLRRQTISLLMVTHDRYFLDRVCNQIIEIDQKRMYRYQGNYAFFLEKRRERIEAANAETERANNLLRKELEWIRRQPQARGTKAKYRVDAFHELEAKAARQRDAKTLSPVVNAAYIGTKIFSAENVSKRFGDVAIVDNFNYVFARYEKLGIVGNNGTGKSTFIKMLTGQLQPDSGRFDIGETIRFGYYSQEGIAFDEQIKVIEVMQNIAEYVDVDGRKLSVSQFLNLFLFPPDKQQNYVFRLSGGEKRRLYLCTILMRNPNFLVLDEPTNDLDIITLNVLEDYLAKFKGCAIIVSHDRYFMDKVVDHILVFKGQADIQDFPGNYTQYREWKEANQPAGKDNTNNKSDKPATTRERPPKAENTKRKPSFKEQREYESLNEEIPRLEQEKQALETMLGSGTLPPQELIAQSQRLAGIIEEIEEKTMRWLELSENISE